MITDLTREFDNDGATLRWDRWGADGGTPFLLCHGFSGSSHDFAEHIEALAVARPVVSIDHRGHGRSQKVGTTEAYAIDQLTADLIAFDDDTSTVYVLRWFKHSPPMNDKHARGCRRLIEELEAADIAMMVQVDFDDADTNRNPIPSQRNGNVSPALMESLGRQRFGHSR